MFFTLNYQLSIINYQLLQSPLRVVAVEVELCEGRSAVGDGNESQFAVCTRHFLRHDAESTVDELVDAPQLFRCGGEVLHAGYLAVGSGCQCAVSAINLNLIVRLSQITAYIGNGSDGPALVWAYHIVAAAHCDITTWPRVLHVFEFLHIDRSDRLVGVATEPETAS